MEVIIIESEAFYKLMEEVMGTVYKTVREAKEEALNSKAVSKDYVGTMDALKLLGLKSKKRLYQLREDKLIDWYQHGRRVLYSKQSIIRYIEGQKVN
ncbi:hypothetical protein NBT05_02550 [Aquimarina sp. ERC-38]|uniref:hypothetical protein n=1 Tax=Aquimarina sp. ERC-38 TaxID=2949996 RepID=UPI0022472432|nr:hypothetical protein [Aquimarina sp. ERC-38]UZO81362.1 hypothetical protein NBT05_02550 [Aquimarina sp. ERC-38]